MIKNGISNFAIDYQQLITPLPSSKLAQIGEKRGNYACLTERHIQAMWLEQKYFKNLLTDEGLPIEIISPGSWNSGAGPDFLNAHIRIGNLDLRGDIELHLSEESWYSHHHHQDPKYDHVILHVSYWKKVKALPITTSMGKRIYTTHLEPFLTISEARILKLIDLDLYPYTRFVGSGRCAKPIFSAIPEKYISDLFLSASLYRLQTKWQFLLEQFGSSTEAIVGGMAMALGYKNNTLRFAEIYSVLKAGSFRDSEDAYVAALRCSGFFGPHYQEKWSQSSKYRELILKSDLLEKTKITLNTHQIRPANHPVRRLCILSKILFDSRLSDLPFNILNSWDSYAHGGIEKKKQKAFLENLLALVPDYSDEYFNHHYSFEPNPKSAFITLVGKDLKKEIVVNVFLPFLLVNLIERNKPAEIEIFYTFFSSLSPSLSKKSKYLSQRLFGNGSNSRLLDNAAAQQGAFQLHKDFCLHFEASCVNCPFVDRITPLLP